MTREEAIAHGEEQLDIFGGEHAEFIKMAISALKQQPICPSSGVDCEDCPAYEPCEDAVSRRKAIHVISACDGKSAQIEALEQLPSVTQKSGEWIDVNDRLPDLKQRVLISYETMDDGKKVDITTYDKYGFLLGKADAWMPLPEPYKAESGDTE